MIAFFFLMTKGTFIFSHPPHTMVVSILHWFADFVRLLIFTSDVVTIHRFMKVFNKSTGFVVSTGVSGFGEEVLNISLEYPFGYMAL